MKRLSVIYAAAAFLLAACENPLEYRPADRRDELVVNALMEAGDGPHEVHVAVSTTTRVRPVSTAAVRCFVNGTQVAAKAAGICCSSRCAWNWKPTGSSGREAA